MRVRIGIALVVLGLGAAPTALGKAQPNLVVTAISDPTPSPTREAVTVSNHGAARAGRSKVGFLLSRDRKPGKGDIRLAKRLAVAAIGAGKHRKVTGNVKVPARTAAGYYHLIACADVRSKVGESDEGDNCRASSHTMWVPGPPPNSPPHAVLEAACGTGSFTAAGTASCQGSDWTFRATGSSDPERKLNTWRIAFGDGTAKTGSFAKSPPKAIPHHYTTTGDIRFVLTVTDRSGAIAHDVMIIRSNTGPAR
jgi:CARDB/PKD domain